MSLNNIYKNLQYKVVETLSQRAFAPIGGGGNPLRAWVLACFDIVSSCFDWLLGCFDIVYAFNVLVFTCFIRYICHPELVSGFCVVNKWRIIYE